MESKFKELTIFLPTFNEAENLKRTVQNVIKGASSNIDKWELIIVNDGSTDDTKMIAEECGLRDRRIRVITHDVNRGYGASLKTGFYSAKYSWISFIDSDGQFDFSEIEKFIEKQKETGADLVIGYYNKRKVSFSKVVTSKIWEAFVFIFFGLKVCDIDCGFKLVSKKVIDKIPKLESERGAFISSELLIKARKNGFRVAEVPVTHYPRLKGKGTGRKLDVIIDSFVDLFKLWKKLL